MQLFCILNVLVNTTNAHSGPEISAAIAKSASEAAEKVQIPQILDPFHHRSGLFDELLPEIRFPHPKPGVIAKPVCIPIPDLHKFPGMIFRLPIGFGLPSEGIPGLAPLPDIFSAGSKVLEKGVRDVPGIFSDVDSGADFLGIGQLIKDTLGSETDEREDERQRAALLAMSAEAPEKEASKTSQPQKAQSNGANGAAAVAASAPAELPKSAPEAAEQPSGAAAPAPALPREISAKKVPVTKSSPVPEALSAVASSVSSALPVAPPPETPAGPAPKDPISSVVSAVPEALTAAASALPIPPIV